MRIKLLFSISLLIGGALQVFGQEYPQMIDKGSFQVQQIIDQTEAYYADKDKGRGSGYKQFKRWEYNAIRTVKEDGFLPSFEEKIEALELWNSYLNETADNTTALPDSWEELGPSYWNATSSWNPGVGRITSFAIDEANEDHILAGANTGGVWRTTDGAQTWTPLNDYFTNLSVYALAMHPSDVNTYYFGSDAGKIFKSTDAGATWNELGNIGYSMVNKILIHPTNPDLMFATAENVGIYRSIDGGNTWTNAVTDVNGFDIEFKPGDLSTVYASGKGFHKSIDGGATFTTISGLGNGPKMIGISADNPEVVYVIQANNGKFDGFFTSSDSGDSFSKVDHGNLNFFGYSTSGNDNNGQAPRDMDIAVNPTNVNEVHIAGINTWRSIDGGLTFEPTSDWIPANAANANIGYCHADVDILAFYGTTLYVGTDGGLFRATDTNNVNPDYYEDITTGMGIRQFYKIGVAQTQEKIISGGSQDNGTSIYTEQAGWRDWLGADGMETFVDKTNPNFVYGTSQFGSLYKSANRGITSFGLNPPGAGTGNWVTPFEQDPILENTMYVGYKKILKSTNGGINWTPISQDFGYNLDNLKIAPSNSLVMYASRGTMLYRTMDGGETDWIKVTMPGGRINDIAVHPSKPNKLAVATTGAIRIYVSEDYGASWEVYKKNLPNFSSLAVVWDDNGKDGLYLGMDYGIFYIDNTFDEWQDYSNLLPNVMINELEVNTETRMLYAGSYGRGLWISPLVERELSTQDNVFEKSLKLYPNPTTTEITLEFAKSIEGEVRVFDITGKLLIFDAEAKFLNKYKMNVSALAPGTYFVRINTLEGTATKKFLKK